MTPAAWFGIAVSSSIALAIGAFWAWGFFRLVPSERASAAGEDTSQSGPFVFTTVPSHILPQPGDNTRRIWIGFDPADMKDWRTRRNEAVADATRAALTDFGRPQQTANPYPLGDPLREIWAFHCERVTREQMEAADEAMDWACAPRPRSADMRALADAAEAQP